MQPSSPWVGSTSALNASARLGLLARPGGERPDDDDFGHAILLLWTGRASYAPRGESGRNAGERRINHVSVNARDLQESVDFYVDLLGAEPIATPNFGLPVQWLALGRTQLHLFETRPDSRRATTTSASPSTTSSRSTAPPSAATRSTTRRSATTSSSCPGDLVQLYVRDPAGNLVEIDHHGVDRLPDDLRAQLKRLWDFNPQSDENMSARLFIGV